MFCAVCLFSLHAMGGWGVWVEEVVVLGGWVGVGVETAAPAAAPCTATLNDIG